ncbi:MAG: hypothetical protein HZA94_03300 [Candidatus Vogelbacteria bacterium]|nr:hypothetical protein [Candidatus Vogelbacteria bacterium]
MENLLLAWKEFSSDKNKSLDVSDFSFNLMDNIIELHLDLVNHNYKHSDYQAFNIDDPKPRVIHKAVVRDRLLHHAIHRILYVFFSKTFITGSYSCQLQKGTFKAINQLRTFANIVSKNNIIPTGYFLAACRGDR